ncbi:DNA repair protein-2 [Coleophoma cylindrospora]|uniref:DNA repair protein REV1 n=1 Tax=Coleophoma cylindrospora TaxID=1849047 RepID=A0A3D8SFG9_9HELO|nr:DNA repair protein-2 [Coleophoma cylindrospora]
MGSRLEKGSESTRKRIQAHSFDDEEGDEYEGSKFGGFTEYFRRKKIKLQNLDAELRSSSTQNPKLFRGIVAHVNGYTQPSLNDLHRLIVSHGGGFSQYLDGKTSVTHIIAANLTPKKAIEFRKYRIVKPAWVVDSIKAEKLLPWDAYRVVDEGVNQRLLGFDDGKIVTQANTQQRTYREQTNTSWYTSQVKAVAEDIDDEIEPHFPSTQPLFAHEVGYESSHNAERAQHSHNTTAQAHQQSEPSSSANFDVTSSLEDALKAVDDAEEDDLDQLAGTSTIPAPGVAPLDSEDTKDLGSTKEPRNTSSVATGNFLPGPSTRRTKHDQVTAFYNELLKDVPPLSKETEAMTAEEHNAILLADPHIRKSSTANPGFLKQYYAESRLHHLSTWKADLKSRFQQMALDRSPSQKNPFKRKPSARRYVLHVDFDSFFCAVSLKSAPEYIDKPAVVAHGSGTGSEIASCNYPARAFGVKNGMWMKHALKLCSDIKVLPYDFPAYEEASKGFYEAIIDVGGVVQSVSVDEALVDVTSLCLPAGGSEGLGINEGSIWREQEKADEIAAQLRTQIKERTGCAVSVGIGGNILLAKIALRRAKPAGQYQIKPEEVLEFIGELNVENLPGVAYSIGGKLEEIGVKFVKDVRQLSKDRLMTVLGPKTGEKLWDYSRGIDRTEVGEQVIRKSVSAEVNWGIRFISQPEAEEFVQNLCGELNRRLIEQRVKGKQFTMKIMRKAADAPLDPPKHLGHGKCDTFNKSIVLGVATNSAEILGREAISILRSYGFSPGELRGLGVQMTKLEPLKSDALPDGSQRRINFGSAGPKLAKKATEDPIDDPESPKAQKAQPISVCADPIDDIVTPQKPKVLQSRSQDENDPIDDKISPLRPKPTPVHPAAIIARTNAADQSATKRLNLTGTQFIIPSQIDPSVLAELPQDIRSKLLAQSKSRPNSRAQSPAVVSRPQSPAIPAAAPLPSQLDPEVFDALPEDMKAEVLASYSSHNAHPYLRNQTLLPQSPRKPRPLPPKKTTPTKRRGRPKGAFNRPKPDTNSAYTQSNFNKSEFLSKSKDQTDSEGYVSDTLDPEFLSALPEDVRQEVIDEHRRNRLAKKSHLILTTGNVSKRPKAVQEGPVPGGRKLRLPPRPAKPTFTTMNLSKLSELRGTIKDWFREFKHEGPNIEDVGALERYLRRVVVDERDLSKVVGVVKWIAWLIEDADDQEERVGAPGCEEKGKGKRAWEEALKGIKDKIQEAVKERGLGRLELSP